MTQPEALRLAAALSAAIKQVDADDDVIHVARWFVEDADAELRRLYEAHEWQYKMAGERLRRIEKLEAQRDALLEALRTLLSYANTLEMRLDADGEHRAMQKARAAIKAVEEGK